MLFSTGCATDWQRRIDEAGQDKARADLVDEALAAAPLPDLPADCRQREASGIALGDRLDVAVVKAERALGRANGRVGRCAGFYDAVKAGRKGE